MDLRSEKTDYQVGPMVAETSASRIYVCKDIGSGTRYLLQIATGAEHNGGFERAAYILKELRKTADEFEEAHAKLGSGRLLSYERLFPMVVESFVSKAQGDRRVTIFAFSEVEDIRHLVPLSNLTNKHNLRVDLRTSAWIMGRLLKLLAFAHGEGITVHSLAGGNILLVPASHFAVVFDWSSAQTHPDKPLAQFLKDDIESAAKAVFVALGGDPATGTYPYLHELLEGEQRYIELLVSMMQRRETSAEHAHQMLYELLDELYGRTFHKFTTLPR